MFEKMLLIIVIAIFSYVAIAKELPYNDCAPVGSYRVKGITMDLECLDSICCLPVRRKASTTISFEANTITAQDLKHEVTVNVEGSQKIVDVEPKKCPDGVCPINEHESRDYEAQFMLNFHVDPIWVELKWQTFNHAQQQLFCFEIPFIVYNPDIDDCPLFRHQRHSKYQLSNSRLSKFDD